MKPLTPFAHYFLPAGSRVTYKGTLRGKIAKYTWVDWVLLHPIRNMVRVSFSDVYDIQKVVPVEELAH